MPPCGASGVGDIVGRSKKGRPFSWSFMHCSGAGGISWSAWDDLGWPANHPAKRHGTGGVLVAIHPSIRGRIQVKSRPIPARCPFFRKLNEKKFIYLGSYGTGWARAVSHHIWCRGSVIARDRRIFADIHRLCITSGVTWIPVRPKNTGRFSLFPMDTHGIHRSSDETGNGATKTP